MVNRHTREWQHVTDRVRAGRIDGLQCPRCAGLVLADWAPFDDRAGGEFHLLCNACGEDTYVLLGEGDPIPEPSPVHYALEIHHPVLINDLPAAEYSALDAEWKTLPVWRKLVFPPKRFRPLRTPGTARVTADTQRVRSSFMSPEAALAAARRMADEMGSDTNPWTRVCVVAVSGTGREIVDGIYPFGGGRT